MTFIEVGAFIIDVEKIIYIQMLSQASIEIYFDKDVKIRISGQDAQELIRYLLDFK
jgi:hypothetical protein